MDTCVVVFSRLFQFNIGSIRISSQSRGLFPPDNLSQSLETHKDEWPSNAEYMGIDF